MYLHVKWWLTTSNPSSLDMIVLSFVFSAAEMPIHLLVAPSNLSINNDRKEPTLYWGHSWKPSCSSRELTWIREIAIFLQQGVPESCLICMFFFYFSFTSLFWLYNTHHTNMSFKVNVLMAWMQQWGSIFHSWFLGKVLFKFDLSRVLIEVGYY